MPKLNNFIITATCLLLFLSNNNQLFADGKNVNQWQGPHKHIVREAYKRLKLHLGCDIPELQKHIGDNQNGSDQFNPGGLVVIGAFREDEEDIVYKYGGIGNINVFNTHFWKADDGDDVLTTFPSIISIIGSFPNAFVKTKKYINGDYDFRVGFVNYRYSSLFSYYKTGKIYSPGYWDIAGLYLNDPASYIHNQATRDRIVWEIIGRVCHLLADINTPAHVKNDMHFPPCPTLGKYDFYEHEMDARYYNYTAQTAENYGSLVPIYYTHFSIPNANTLKNLFYTSAQIADHFNSDDEGGNDYPGSNDPFTNYYVGVNNSGNFITLQQKIASLPPVSNNYDKSVNRYEINVDSVAMHCFALFSSFNKCDSKFFALVCI